MGFEKTGSFMSGVGPFPIAAVIVVVAIFFAWLTARFVAIRVLDPSAKRAGALVFDAAIIGLIAARIGYIALWWPEYVASPWSMLAIGDGGFAWWAGLPMAVLFVGWRTRTQAALRRPALVGIAVGMLVWAGGSAVPELLRKGAPPLPDLALTRLDGTPVSLEAYRGQPVVVNLWATWCPPCRREMPVLQHAQEAYSEVSFVLVNQRESAQIIERFLEQEALTMSDVLLDLSGQVMQAVGTRALPTTLFYDAEGRLVDSHMGELTRASLGSTLQRRFGVAAAIDP